MAELTVRLVQVEERMDIALHVFINAFAKHAGSDLLSQMCSGSFHVLPCGGTFAGQLIA